MQQQPNNMPFRVLGLGDCVYFVTLITGISWLVHKLNKATGFECGCNKRRGTMNSWFSVRWKRWQRK